MSPEVIHWSMSHGTEKPWDVGGFIASAFVLTVVGFLGLIAISLWMVVLRDVATAMMWSTPLSPPRVQVVGTVASGTGLLMTAAGYMAWSNRSLEFIDVEWPTLKHVGWIVVGLVGLFAALYAISTLFQTFGVSTSQHTTSQAAKDNPALLLPLIPLSILLIGPGEELLYRNVVQKALYDTAPRWVAVLTASVVFSLVHFSAYSTGTTAEIFASLTIVFALSLILGVIYERTENVVVPALVHGGYNALTFALAYLELTSGTV